MRLLSVDYVIRHPGGTMLTVSLVLILAAVVLAGLAVISTSIRRLEGATGTLDEGTAPALRYRVPNGMDAAAAVVTLHHRGYDVTPRYQDGETDLYIRTVDGGQAEREEIRTLIYNAGDAEHEDWHPAPRTWHPDEVRFA